MSSDDVPPSFADRVKAEIAILEQYPSAVEQMAKSHQEQIAEFMEQHPSFDKDLRTIRALARPPNLTATFVAAVMVALNKDTAKEELDSLGSVDPKDGILYPDTSAVGKHLPSSADCTAALKAATNPANVTPELIALFDPESKFMQARRKPVTAASFYNALGTLGKVAGFIFDAVFIHSMKHFGLQKAQEQVNFLKSVKCEADLKGRVLLPMPFRRAALEAELLLPRFQEDEQAEYACMDRRERARNFPDNDDNQDEKTQIDALGKLSAAELEAKFGQNPIIRELLVGFFSFSVCDAEQEEELPLTDWKNVVRYWDRVQSNFPDASPLEMNECIVARPAFTSGEAELEELMVKLTTDVTRDRVETAAGAAYDLACVAMWDCTTGMIAKTKAEPFQSQRRGQHQRLLEYVNSIVNGVADPILAQRPALVDDKQHEQAMHWLQWPQDSESK